MLRRSVLVMSQAVFESIGIKMSVDMDSTACIQGVRIMRLSTEQAIQFADFALAATAVANETDFHRLIEQQVQPLLPHGFLLAVIGQLSFEHLTVHRHIAVNYPEWARDQVIQPINIRERPLLQRWLHTRAPVIACPVADRALMSEREIFEAEAIGLGRMALHGLPDLTSRMGSYFSFAQVPQAIDKAELTLRMTIMTPLLHIAMFQATKGSSGGARPGRHLTAIEQELLVWLAAGRSNDEMAQLRQRSPATIRNQLAKLYEKLGVSTRAEAVAFVLSEAQHVPLPER
jgi:DNA-binding CsgD family transcriptional regulator